MITHPNGLALKLPLNLRAEPRSAGFRVTPAEGGPARIPSVVDVTLQPTARPEGTFPETRPIAGGQARYRIEEGEGGSAGPQFVLTAWLAYGRGHVLVRQTTQAEFPAKPDFSLAWIVIAGLAAPGAATGL